MLDVYDHSPRGFDRDSLTVDWSFPALGCVWSVPEKHFAAYFFVLQNENPI